ncbi:MAG TPA: hypothetical protein VEF34_04605 [Syntrophobacteraceae bacterium]|nr:hypothetical protein [Syntrophobacteraceae bacterium]
MEEAELSEVQQLGYKALIAEKILQYERMTAISQNLEDESPRIDIRDFSGSPIPQSRPYLSTGYWISGQSVSENAYEVEFDEFIAYYRRLAGKHGVRFKIDKPSISASSRPDQVAVTSVAHPPAFYSDPGLVLYLVSTPPYAINLPAQLLDFSNQYGLHQCIDTAIRLVAKCFANLKTAFLKMECEPEGNEEWLTLEIVVQDSVENVFSAYNKFTELWVSLSPWPQRDKIRLAFDIR